MNPSSLLAMLQATLTLLMAAQNPHASAATVQAAIRSAQSTIQFATQAQAHVDNFPKNVSNYPSISGVASAPYIDGSGMWVPLGATVQLIQSETSFGDINNDGLDDATVVVNRPNASSSPNYYLAALLNQNGILFNIADYPLGPGTINFTTHSINNGVIILDGQHFVLSGTQLIKTQ